MEWQWYLITLPLLWIVLYIVFSRQKLLRKVIRHTIIKKHNKSAVIKEILEMEEFAKRFIGKSVIVYTIKDSNNYGVVEEVENVALVLKDNDELQLINMEYIISIEEVKEKKKKK